MTLVEEKDLSLVKILRATLLVNSDDMRFNNSGLGKRRSRSKMPGYLPSILRVDALRYSITSRNIREE